MPISSLNDPIDVARAQAALDAAWGVVSANIPEEARESQRTRLAYIVASYAVISENAAALVDRAVTRFRKSPNSPVAVSLAG